MTPAELRQAEVDLGFSPAGMAEIIGITPMAYALLRSGYSKLPASNRAWERIRDALELRRMKEGM